MKRENLNRHKAGIQTKKYTHIHVNIQKWESTTALELGPKKNSKSMVLKKNSIHCFKGMCRGDCIIKSHLVHNYAHGHTMWYNLLQCNFYTRLCLSVSHSDQMVLTHLQEPYPINIKCSWIFFLWKIDWYMSIIKLFFNSLAITKNTTIIKSTKNTLFF